MHLIRGVISFGYLVPFCGKSPLILSILCEVDNTFYFNMVSQALVGHC